MRTLLSFPEEHRSINRMCVFFHDQERDLRAYLQGESVGRSFKLWGEEVSGQATLNNELSTLCP